VKVQDRVDLDADIIFGDHGLSRNREDSDLDVHDPQLLREWVDLDEARVDRLITAPITDYSAADAGEKKAAIQLGNEPCKIYQSGK
jgi:hypothetical protein